MSNEQVVATPGHRLDEFLTLLHSSSMWHLDVFSIKVNMMLVALGNTFGIFVH